MATGSEVYSLTRSRSSASSAGRLCSQAAHTFLRAVKKVVKKRGEQQPGRDAHVLCLWVCQ